MTWFWGNATLSSQQRASGWHLQVFCPWSCNIPSSYSIRERGLLSQFASELATEPELAPPPSTQGNEVWRKSCQPWIITPKAVCKLETDSVFSIPQTLVQRGFSLVQIQFHTSTASLSLPFVSPQKGIPPLCAYTAQAVPVGLWICFCHSVAWIPGIPSLLASILLYLR